MERNDTVLPFFGLLLAVGLFLTAYLDGRHIRALAGGAAQPLSVGQVGLLGLGIALLVYAAIGFVSVWLEGEELRVGTHRPEPGRRMWLGMLLSALAVALSGLFVQAIRHSLRSGENHPAVEGAIFACISVTVAALLALYKHDGQDDEVWAEPNDSEVPW